MVGSTIFGRDSGSVHSRAELGYLPEQPYFYDQLSVYELVALYATLAGVKRAILREKVLAALDKVNLLERLNTKVRALSKGLTQRVALAQAIVASPRLLILDEPFSGLDPIGRAEFKEIFKQLKSQSVTIFICTHILSDAEFLCDRVSIMARGELKGVYELRSLKQLTGYQLVLCGDSTALAELSALSEQSEQIADANGPQLRLSFSEYSKAQVALERALKAGCSIRSFEPRQASLEDLFQQVVKLGGAT
jgi:ABC-2 type transport system ATP-binding protein